MAIIRTDSVTGSQSLPHYTRKRGKKQSPFVKTVKPPLPYYMEEKILGKHALGSLGGQCGRTFWGEIQPTHICTSGFESNVLYFDKYGDQAYARAYNKFKDQAYTQAANLTAISERVKTFDMILARLQQLHKGAKALKAGRFKEFLDTFGIRALKKHENTQWTRPKQFGALWLEYWMGWAPTVGDVYTSLDAVSREIPDHTIRAGSSVPLDRSTSGWSGSSFATANAAGRGTVWVQGQVSITNPSLHIAQTLGLVNPIKTLWETTGFSWLADWFTNVGQILGQVTDWVGLQLKNIIVSVKTEMTTSWQMLNAHLTFGASFPSVMYHEKSYLCFSRYILPKLPLVKPIFRLPNGLSLTRGATLASLLATMFAPSRR